MKKFLYVFSREAKGKMLSCGYKLMKEDLRNNVYVFRNEPNGNFALNDISYIEEDTLWF